MIVQIIGILIGLAILCGGLYYFMKEKEDRESRKIYGGISFIGAIIFIVAFLLFLL